ncbi:MAG: 3'-5' exonuclease domain-containing protein 2 [Bacteroidetes bacterium]|nr:3'-5' exonuclease domain-containing protein 2 [Bacteroidota bacterium]
MKLFQSEITKEEVATLDLIQFEGPITLIQTEEEFGEAIEALSAQTILGFDTETKPSFKKGKMYPTSLIQLSSPEHAWLIRVSRLGYPRQLLNLLSDGKVMKVGTGLNDDIRRMRSDFQFEPGGFLDLQNYVEAFKIWEKGLKKMSAIVLGYRISKSQQVSNWDADILTEAQLRYAATDAWICLEIYNELRNALNN